MDLKDFLVLADDLRPEEFAGFAHLAQLYWEARTDGRRGLTQEDVDEPLVEFLIELFTFDAGYGVYIHPGIEAYLENQSKAKSSTLDLFEAFWSSYPRKVAKATARKAWAKHIKTSALAQKVISALKRQIAYYDWPTTGDQTHVPHAATWLNAERWEDELPAMSPRTSATSHHLEGVL